MVLGDGDKYRTERRDEASCLGSGRCQRVGACRRKAAVFVNRCTLDSNSRCSGQVRSSHRLLTCCLDALVSFDRESEILKLVLVDEDHVQTPARGPDGIGRDVNGSR
jgi:hypothetical protein